MNKNKFLLLLIIPLLIVGLTSAMEWDNRARYISDTEVVIENWLGLGDDLAKIELLENTDNCWRECYAIWNVTIYHEDEVFVTAMNFKDTNGEYVAKEYTYEYARVYEEVEVPVYADDCSILANGSESCSKGLIK